MKTTKKILLAAGLLCLGTQAGNAQYLMNSDSAFKAGMPMSGHLWGYVFGDYYYKAHSDSLGRGGSNQFTGTPKGANAFDLRRVYLGYDFNISDKFSTHLLLTAEDWSAGEKLTPFVKYANLSWNNIWKGSDLVIGLSATPAFSSSSEKFWGYRSVERTIADVRRSSSYDLGVALKGTFDEQHNYGYHVMVGNGSGAKADKNNFRKFYGSVYGLFFDKKMMVHLYADYERLEWLPGFHHASNMTKLFVGYKWKTLTAGAEAFVNHAQNDVIATSPNGIDTLNANAGGLSLFVRGKLLKDKLGYFARVDIFQPYFGFENSQQYEGLSKNYEPNNKEQFITAGLDFSPTKNVHIIPNVWYNAYRAQHTGLNGAAGYDYDLAYRLTFYYTFGR